MPTLEETQSAEKVRFLNDLALARVLKDHPAILIRPADLPSWRPCRQSCVGVLEGLEHLGTLVPLCTDGCVAWFAGRYNVRAKGVEGEIVLDTFLLHGHVASFLWANGEKKGAPPQPHSLPKPQEKGKTASREGRPRTPSALDAALDLLRNLK